MTDRVSRVQSLKFKDKAHREPTQQIKHLIMPRILTLVLIILILVIVAPKQYKFQSSNDTSSSMANEHKRHQNHRYNNDNCSSVHSIHSSLSKRMMQDDNNNTSDLITAESFRSFFKPSDSELIVEPMTSPFINAVAPPAPSPPAPPREIIASGDTDYTRVIVGTSDQYNSVMPPPYKPHRHFHQLPEKPTRFPTQVASSHEGWAPVTMRPDKTVNHRHHQHQYVQLAPYFNQGAQNLTLDQARAYLAHVATTQAPSLPQQLTIAPTRADYLPTRDRDKYLHLSEFMPLIDQRQQHPFLAPRIHQPINRLEDLLSSSNSPARTQSSTSPVDLLSQHLLHLISQSSTTTTSSTPAPISRRVHPTTSSLFTATNLNQIVKPSNSFHHNHGLELPDLTQLGDKFKPMDSFKQQAFQTPQFNPAELISGINLSPPLDQNDFLTNPQLNLNNLLQSVDTHQDPQSQTSAQSTTQSQTSDALDPNLVSTADQLLVSMVESVFKSALANNQNQAVSQQPQQVQPTQLPQIQPPQQPQPQVQQQQQQQQQHQQQQQQQMQQSQTQGQFERQQSTQNFPVLAAVGGNMPTQQPYQQLPQNQMAPNHDHLYGLASSPLPPRTRPKNKKSKKHKSAAPRNPQVRVAKRPRGTMPIQQFHNLDTDLQPAGTFHKWKHNPYDDDDEEEGETEINLRFFNNFSRMGPLGGLARSSGPFALLVSMALLLISNISLAATIITHGISAFLRKFSEPEYSSSPSMPAAHSPPSPSKLASRLAKKVHYLMSNPATRGKHKKFEHKNGTYPATANTTGRPTNLDRKIRSYGERWM